MGWTMLLRHGVPDDRRADLIYGIIITIAVICTAGIAV
jgi:hypothetical protein